MTDLKLNWKTTALANEHLGSRHVFVVDESGKTRATIWGPKDVKVKLADLFVAAPTMANAIRAAAREAAVGEDKDGKYARIPRHLYDALENALNDATGEYSAATIAKATGAA